MIIDELKTKYPNAEMRVRKISINRDKRRVECVVCVEESTLQLDEQTISGIIETTKNAVPRGYFVHVTVVEDKPTELDFRKFLADILKRHYPIVANISKERIELNIGNKEIDIVLVVSQKQYDTLESLDFCNELSIRCNLYTSYKANVSMRIDNAISELGVEEQEKLLSLAISRATLKPERYFQVENVVACIGKLITSRPMFISDIRKPMQSCTICGRISDKQLTTTKSNQNLQVLRFVLSDDSGASIPCFKFVYLKIVEIDKIMQLTGKSEADAKKEMERNRAHNDRELKKIMRFATGDYVIVNGKVDLSKFSNKLEFQISSLCLCHVVENKSQLKYRKAVPKSYVAIQPETYEEYRQMSFTKSLGTVSDIVKDKKLVALFVNTTGYSPMNDNIFAISCFKVSDGVLTESLSSYVNPEISLTDKQIATAKAEHGTFSFSRTLTEIIPDIYKFCHGATLVGYDLEKILPMLNYYAEPVGFEFNNDLIDLSELFSKLFEFSHVGKNTNFAMLTDVCKNSRVAYDGSDYCKDKAHATADVIVALGTLLAF